MTFEECETQEYPHNHRCRFIHGFFCNDCGTFFPKDRQTFMRYEYMFTLWGVLHTIQTECLRNGEPCPEPVAGLCQAFDGVPNLSGEELDKLAVEALAFIRSHGKTHHNLMES